jgi:ubiquinone/menaquinone biosynthesis C-methylase UbiE
LLTDCHVVELLAMTFDPTAPADHLKLNYPSPMFTKTAKHYDAVYSDKDYGRESEIVVSLIRERVPETRTLLDVACGTGRHLEYLARQFDCTGVDLDEEMLEIARERVPSLTLHTGDMRNFALDTRFDAVTCLFSSIGYTKTVERMEETIANMAAHLLPGGILAVEPWITPESWIVGKAHSSTVETDEFIVTRMMVAEPVERGRVVFEYLVGDSSGISKISETHEMGWFTHLEYISAFEKAGLTPEYIQPGITDRDLYFGKKPRVRT